MTGRSSWWRGIALLPKRRPESAVTALTMNRPAMHSVEPNN